MDKNPRYMKYLKLFIGLLILSQIEVACGEGVSTDKQAVAPPLPYEAQMPEGRSKALDTAGLAEPQDKRKVIVSHSMGVEVERLGPAFDKAAGLAEKNGGYTTSTNRYRAPDGTMHAQVGMRVPPDKAEGVLLELRKLGKVTAESSSGEDITGQYVDLEARLRNARASEARLLDMMERRSASLSDVLAVERELTRVRGDIESMEARKRGWDTLTGMVAITVELFEPPGALPSGRKVWEPVKTAFAEAAEGFAQSLHYAIVFAGAVIPWLLVVGIFVFVFFRVVRRRRPKG